MAMTSTLTTMMRISTPPLRYGTAAPRRKPMISARDVASRPGAPSGPVEALRRSTGMLLISPLMLASRLER
jgi:hypothetical protein